MILSCREDLYGHLDTLNVKISRLFSDSIDGYKKMRKSKAEQNLIRIEEDIYIIYNRFEEYNEL